MSDLYRVNIDHEAGYPRWRTDPNRSIDDAVKLGVLVPVEPVGYVYKQGGTSPAFYACDREEADYMLIPIMGADDE